MENRDIGLERLCRIYLDLTDGDKEKIIRLGEGLLNSQKVMDNEKALLKGENKKRANLK